MAPAGVIQHRKAFAITLPVVAVVAATPFLLPADAFLPRALLTGFAISFAMKLRLLRVGRDADPAMLATLPRLLLWLLVPPATTWPRDAEAARQARRRAMPHLLGALLRVAALLPLTWAKLGWSHLGWLDYGQPLNPAAPLLWGLPALVALTVVQMLQFYLLLTAMSDGLIGLCNLTGVTAEEPFVHPVRARGPAEFWSLRWNRVVHRFARCEVFLPVVRRRGPVLAVLATFAASGVMHEYLVLSAVGLAAYQPGLMMLFFLAQALSLLAERALVDRHGRRRWPPLLHLGWLTMTTPLFFRPLGPQIAAFDAACLQIGRRLLALVS